VPYTMIYFSPEGDEKRFLVKPGESYKIGNSSSNDIVFPQRDVSREHAILHVKADTLQIVDLKSKNGTFINGNRTSAADFSLGDYIDLSSARFVIVDSATGLDSGEFQDLDVRAFGLDSDSGGVTRALSRCFNMDDLLDLFAVTSRAVRDGSEMDPLVWGVSRMGLVAGLVFFLDENGKVSILKTAGDIGLLLNGFDFERLVENIDDTSRPTVQQVKEVQEDVLVFPLIPRHYLLLLHEDSAPAVGDVLILGEAVKVVLTAHQERMASARGELLDLEALCSLTLADARHRFENWMINRVIDQCDDNLSEAARRLGMTRAGLARRVKRV